MRSPVSFFQGPRQGDNLETRLAWLALVLFTHSASIACLLRFSPIACFVAPSIGCFSLRAWYRFLDFSHFAVVVYYSVLGTGCMFSYTSTGCTGLSAIDATSMFSSKCYRLYVCRAYIFLTTDTGYTVFSTLQSRMFQFPFSFLPVLLFSL